MAMADHRPYQASVGGHGMDELYLRSGIFLAPFHNHDENPTLSIERDLELLEHLDRLNYHEAWIGEHHSGGFELIACPEMFIAAAAQRTRHIRLGTGVVSLPYHNPFMLADRMVQLDHMTRGRAMFGVGPGALVHDALKIGIDPGAQRQMMNEALEVIIPLLRGETVNRRTDWFNLTEAQLQLCSYTRPTMELAVAAARSPAGSLAAGKYGIGMLSIGGTSPTAMEAHTRNWGLYEETARANGHVPDRKNWRIVGMFHIAETREHESVLDPIDDMTIWTIQEYCNGTNNYGARDQQITEFLAACEHISNRSGRKNKIKNVRQSEEKRQGLFES